MKKKVILDSTIKQEFQSQNESIEFDWESDVDNGILIKNTKLGLIIYYYAVFDTNNQFKYDTIGIAEREGNSVVVVLNQNNEIGLLQEHRFMPAKYFLSCPRGFADFQDERRLDTALREVMQEVGVFKIIETVDLGNLYQNTTFFLNPIGVILVKLEMDKKIVVSYKP